MINYKECKQSVVQNLFNFVLNDSRNGQIFKYIMIITTRTLQSILAFHQIKRNKRKFSQLLVHNLSQKLKIFIIHVYHVGNLLAGVFNSYDSLTLISWKPISISYTLSITCH